MLFGSSTAQQTSQVLRRLGFQELFPLATVPVHNARRMRYTEGVTARRDGSRWSVRSYGTDFDLVDPSRRSTEGRWYSLGWGLLDWQPVEELLLVHADETAGDALSEAADALAFALDGCGARWTRSLGTTGHLTGLRLAAVLPGAQNPLRHGEPARHRETAVLEPGTEKR